jgi:hypothetical protein
MNQFEDSILGKLAPLIKSQPINNISPDVRRMLTGRDISSLKSNRSDGKR